MINETLTNDEIFEIKDFLNRDGYVLYFKASTLNDFVYQKTGVDLSKKYSDETKLNWGRFNRLVDSDINEKTILKLLSEILDYYEQNFRKYPTEQEKERIEKYEKFKNIINKHCNSKVSFKFVDLNNKNIEVLKEQLIQNVDINPTEAIGKAKEYIESVCKIILNKKAIDYKKMNLNQLVSKAINITDKLQGLELKNNDAKKSIDKLLSSLNNVAQSIAEIRNNYGSGHGKDGDFISLNKNHARLVVESTIAITNFLISSYQCND